MSRTANLQRPQELRTAIVRYLISHGLSDLSLRPLARAVGSSPRVLLYYFGSKEKMVTQVLAEVRRQQFASYSEIDGETSAQAAWIVWKRMSAPDSEPLFRVFFEAYGIALQQPKLYKSFLNDTVKDWLRLVSDDLCQQGYGREEAQAFATVLLAGLRGFMLDYCNTQDRKRLDRAVKLWASGLDGMLASCQARR